jgi:serine/threonine protein kinase
MTPSDSERPAAAGTEPDGRLDARARELEEFRRLLDEPPGRRAERLAAIAAVAESLADRLRRLLDSVADEVEVRDREAADPNLGRRIGRWTLERVIGRGSSARVYLATAGGEGQEEGPEEVALKVFERSDLGPGFRRRLAREIEALKRIGHPGVVRFVEEGIDPASGRPWLAMELVRDGMGIVEHVATKAATLDERVGLIGQMREALAAAHAAGVVHRDLSPRNVLVDRDGRVKIVDFGIASIVQESLSSHGTVTGTIVAGTPATMAPEQVDPSFGPIGPWTDEYAAAAIACRLLTGRYPYDTSGSLASVLQAIVHVPARLIRELEPGVPETVAAWVDGGLVKAVSARPLVHAMGSRRIPSRADRRRGRPVPAAVLGACAAFVGTVFFVALARDCESGPSLKPGRSSAVAEELHEENDMRLDPMSLSVPIVAALANAVCAQDNHVLSLAGIGQYCHVPHSASLAASEEVTVEYWVRVDDDGTLGRIGKTAPSDGQWGLEPSAAGLASFSIHGSAFVANVTHPVHAWFHLAGTWSRSTGVASVYVNGELMSSSTGNGAAMQNVNYPIVIGYQPFFSNTQLFGAVDNFRVWTIARSASQIRETMNRQIFSTESVSYPGLVLSLNFENSAGDASPFGNHGSLMGGATIGLDNDLPFLRDCDGDGISDVDEIARGAPDLNSNGVPDSCECLGDVDSSGATNAIDIAIILGVWGTSGGKYPAADIDQSGVVDAQDLTVVLSGWGPCP